MRRFLAVMLLLMIQAGGGRAAPALSTVLEVYDQAAGGWHETWMVGERAFTVDAWVWVPAAEVLPLLRVTKAKIMTAGAARGGYFNAPCEGAGFPRSPLQPADACFDVPYAENNPMTLWEADTLMARELCRLSGGKAEMALEGIVLLGRLRKVDAASGKFQEPLGDMGGYVLYYRQTLRGAPIVADASGRQTGDGGIAGTVFTSEDFQAVFTLWTETCAAMEDVPLRSLEAVKDTVKALLAQGEIESVSGLALGYAVCQDAGGGEDWAVPAWLLTCGEGGAPGDAAAGCSGVLISAQTGEVLRPGEGMHCPQTRPW